MTQKTIPFLGEKAYCPFYAIDPDSGLVVASVLTTAQELGLRVAARLVAGQWVTSLWNMGLKMELIVPLRTFGCEGWQDTTYHFRRGSCRCSNPDSTRGR